MVKDEINQELETDDILDMFEEAIKKVIERKLFVEDKKRLKVKQDDFVVEEFELAKWIVDHRLAWKRVG